MKNKRELAIAWFNSLSSLRRTEICDTNQEIVGVCRRYETLTGREIELLYIKLNRTLILTTIQLLTVQLYSSFGINPVHPTIDEQNKIQKQITELRNLLKQ